MIFCIPMLDEIMILLIGSRTLIGHTQIDRVKFTKNT